MINFFRKIRKKLADDNKPLKYARYAIGEIFLVVIGILIALQINNWNEQQTNNERLKQNLTSLIKDLNLDKRRLEVCLKFDEEKRLQIAAISDPLPNLIESNDVNDVHFILRTESIIIHDATFSTMSFSNDLGLIRDVNLQNSISKYYSRLKYIKRLEDWYLNSLYPDFLDYINKNPNPKVSDIKGYLKTARAVSRNESVRYKEIIIQLNELIEKVQIELDKY